MRKRTTTQKLNTALTNNMLTIVKAEKYSKTTHKTDVIAPETFKESLEFACESIFSSCIGWYFERDYRTGDYIIETGRMDGNSENVVIAHLRVKDGVDVEDIERILKIEEE